MGARLPHLPQRTLGDVADAVSLARGGRSEAVVERAGDAGTPTESGHGQVAFLEAKHNSARVESESIMC